jgi:hypothetical protein
MSSGHELTCQRPECGRKFTATRSDARFCSRSCRRAKSPPAPLLEVGEPPGSAAEDAPAAAEDELDGWRRVGGFLIPPPDPRNTFSAGWLRVMDGLKAQAPLAAGHRRQRLRGTIVCRNGPLRRQH